MINIYLDIEYQMIDGFGGAFTEAAATTLYKLSPENRKKVLELYFDKESGIKYNFGRVHMNSCDFSLGNYACTDDGDNTLETFNIERDKKAIIPMIKEALEYTDIKLLMSPWSPPAYMKTNGNEAHLFGLEPNFGCCTANFNQGWPKFTLSSFMHNDDTVINVIPVPTELKCDKAYIKLETNYPFENSFKYIIKAQKNFTFKVRIPSFAENLVVNGQTSTESELSYEITAGESKEINMSFEAIPYFEKRPYDLYTVKCGSLVFSLPIKYEKKMYEYEKDGVARKNPYCDYEYIPASEWNYAYCNSELFVKHNEISTIPFSSINPPITIKANVKNIQWDFEDGYETVCAKVPASRLPQSDKTEVILYPYGCSKLRMTEMPLID